VRSVFRDVGGGSWRWVWVVGWVSLVVVVGIWVVVVLRVWCLGGEPRGLL
jgi:hypothetical protein